MTDPRLLDEQLLDAVRRASERHDPVPDGMVERMVAVTRDLATYDPDLELQLMLTVERLPDLAGTRGGARSYTLRFGGDGVDLLVRVGAGEDARQSRVDGWVVPATAGSVRLHEVGGAGRRLEGVAGETGRFEFPEVPSGLYRVCLDLSGDQTFGTPAFEI